MIKTPFERGKEAARAELSKFLHECNDDFARKLSADEDKEPEDETRFSMYDRGVLIGAIVANKTLLMVLGRDEPAQERKLIIVPS